MDRRLYTGDQTKELDRIAIEEFGVSGLDLMKNAGERAFFNIQQNFPDVNNVVVLCGSGNNGGDGYVVANCALSIGLNVSAIQVGSPKTKDAAQVCKEYIDNGGSILGLDNDTPEDADLIVDGLFGTGLNRAPIGKYKDLISNVNSMGCPVVSLDVPSGLESQNGFVFDPCIQASMTVSFIGKKFALFSGQGKNHSGLIVFESINLPEQVYELVKPIAKLLVPDLALTRKLDSHKGNYGNVVIVGGDTGMLGATLLAGRAALRCGSGLVTVLSTDSHLDMPALHSPELMSQSLKNNNKVNKLLNACDAIVFGPGLGQSEWSKTTFKKVIDMPVPKVVDADGLNLLAKNPVKRDDWVLTPHPGEAATLLKSSSQEIQKDRIGAAKAIVNKYGGVCVLKGAGTLVVDNSGDVAVCEAGNPGMATAGMGDVLSGVIGSLLGQKYSVRKAAENGVWVHSASADKVAEKIGEASLIAGDVIEVLPEILKSD